MAYEEVRGLLGRFVGGLTIRRLDLTSGATIWTDTQTIQLPARIGCCDTREQNFLVYKCAVALAWAQIRFGTYRIAPARFPRGESALALLAFLETLRLAARLKHALPGMYRDLTMLMEPAVPAAFDEARSALSVPEATVESSIAWCARLVGRVAPDWPFIVTLVPARAAAVLADRSAREAAALRSALARLREAMDAEEGGDQGGAAPDARAIRLAVTEREDGAEIEFELGGTALPVPAELRALVESLWQDLGRLPPEAFRADGEGPDAGRPQAPHVEAEELVQSEGDAPGALYYDEWDFRRQHYRRDWCVLRERDVLAGDPAFVARTLACYSAQVRELRRSFEALRGEDKRLRGEPNGDDIDLEVLVRARADLRAGNELSERVFTRRARRERDLAVLFMVDMSGSTKGWINDCEREALVLLAEALEVLGDRYAIYGFSGITRKRCEIYRIKRFEEAYDERVRERIAGIQPLDYTRMGVAVRHLTKILAKVEARTRLLVTLSDGKPDDFSDGYRGEYGIEDTRKALIEAKRAGIHSYCITIDRDAADYLPHLYGAVNYSVIENASRLPVKLAEVYRRLTR